MGLEQDIKQKKFSSPYHKAMLNILYTSNWMEDQFKPIMKEFDVTTQQFNVLRILRGRHPEACTASDIKAVMIDKSPDLTRLLDRLIDKKLVTRNTCADNRRKLDILITEQGLDLLSTMDPVLKKQHEETSKRISQKEASELSRILDKLRE
jgi:DNA-binding MarR family transcriptional regulator